MQCPLRFYLCVFLFPVLAHAAQHLGIIRSEGEATISVEPMGIALRINHSKREPRRSPSMGMDIDHRDSMFVKFRDGYHFPVFKSPEDLAQHPDWKTYLTSVYGVSVQDKKNYPIDILNFWVFYPEHFPEKTLPGILEPDNCNLQPLDLYGNMSGHIGKGGHDPPGTVWMYHEPPYKAAPADAWVEVTHCTYGMPGRDSEKTGYWMYYAPGSGVFYNIGKTRVYKTHKDAVTDLLGRDMHDNCESLRDECDNYFYDIVRAAASIGLTSLQFNTWGDMRCGFTALEILDVSNRGDQPCLPNLAGGLRASCACSCNSGSQKGIDKECLSCSLDCDSSPPDSSLINEAGKVAEGVHKQEPSLLGDRSAAEAAESAWRFDIVYWEPPVCLRDSAERQRGIFIAIFLFTALASFGFAQHCHQDQLRSSVILAILSSLFFGLDNFLICYAGSYLCQPRAHMCVMFLLAGSIACFLHASLYARSDAYRTDWKATKNASALAQVCIVLTAVFIGFAQLCSNIGFTLDRQQSGPHQALVCADVLIVAPFFYCYAGETFSRHQLVGTLLIIMGALVMSEISRWSDARNSLASFLWVGCSMMWYGFSVITLRLTGSVPWKPRLILILGGMGFFGFFLFLRNLFAGGLREYYDSPQLLAWPLLNALTSNLGIWAVSFAYEAPGATTGVLAAVVDSNAMVLLLMNRVLLSYIPSTEKLAGMLIILSGCAYLALE